MNTVPSTIRVQYSLFHFHTLVSSAFLLFNTAASEGTSVDKERGKRVVSDFGENRDKEEEEDDWFTADEGVFDKQLGRWVVSPAMLERIKKREKEKADGKVKSATKLKLQFDLDEVIINVCVLF